MSISAKILLPIIFLLAVFVSVFVYAMVYFSGAQEAADLETTRISQINDLAMQIGVLRQQSRYNVLLYRISPNAAYLQTVDHIWESTGQLLDDIRPLLATPTGRALLEDFDTSRHEVARDRDLLITAIASRDAPATDRLFQIWNIKSDNTYAALLDFISYHQRLAEIASRYYDDIVNSFVVFQTATALLMVALIILLYIHLRYTVTQPLKQLSRVAQNITANRFTPWEASTSRDEIGILSSNLKIMSRNLARHRKSLEADVKQKEAELLRLKEFEAQKDSFINIASHELKSPLTSLKLFEQLLKKEVLKNGHRQYLLYLGKIDRQVNTLNRLITSLLDVAKLQIGNIPFAMQPFDLTPVVREVVDNARHRSRKHVISLETNLNKPVYGDKDRIVQVLENILSNAIKYSPRGSQIRVQVQSGRSQATVSVRDFGIGISPADQKKIFRRYYRVSDNNDKEFPGFGIGLYISHTIVIKHGGKFWVKSRPGHGSTFFFTLPFKAGRTPTSPPAS